VSHDRSEAVLSELAHLRTRMPELTGTLVASIDGLLVAHDTQRVDPEPLAAMSAAQIGLSRQFSATAGQGEYVEAVTRSTDGCLAVFAAGAHALLTVFGPADLNIGRLYHEARPVARRLAAVLAPEQKPDIPVARTPRH
jgi:uncharacterized protein